jgi:hypothetical protein
MTAFTGWQNFYVIVGSSAGALIGLQFILITLIVYIPVGEGGAQAGQAFATPTIIHFASVLMLAGIMTAPWQGTAPAATLWGLLGTFGLLYTAIVARRVRRQGVYQPEFEDWLFHVLLPLVAYGTLASSAFVAHLHLRGAMFAVAGVAMLLLMIGIHNAWDAATYHVYVIKPKRQEPQPRGESAQP